MPDVIFLRQRGDGSRKISLEKTELERTEIAESIKIARILKRNGNTRPAKSAASSKTMNSPFRSKVVPQRLVHSETWLASRASLFLSFSRYSDFPRNLVTSWLEREKEKAAERRKSNRPFCSRGENGENVAQSLIIFDLRPSSMSSSRKTSPHRLKTLEEFHEFLSLRISLIDDIKAVLPKASRK